LPLSTLNPSCSRRALAADISGESWFNFSSNFITQSLAARPACSVAAFAGAVAGDGEIGTVMGVHGLLGAAEAADDCIDFNDDGGTRGVADPEETAAVDRSIRTRRPP
jgi:hypothetical protein